MDILIEIRNKFKKNGDFVMSDYIRVELMKSGIVLVDSKEGTTYKIKQ